MAQSTQGPGDIPQIALVSANPKTFSEEIVARLKRRQWAVSVQTPRISEALQALHSNQCTLLLVHDTPELPASFILRSQILDPLGILTPTIVVCDRAHNQEMPLLKELGMPELIESDENPAAFVGGFEWLIRRWNQGSLRRLYQARRHYLAKEFLPFSKIMTSLKTEPELLPLVTPCMAQILMRQTDYKAVEKLLLAALKEHPRNIGIIINTVEFYMRAAMPETALKILSATRKNHGNPRLLISDQIQAHLMLNELSPCIELLEELVREDYCRRQAQDFLARCLYAEGHLDRFRDAIQNHLLLADEFKQKWNKSAS